MRMIRTVSVVALLSFSIAWPAERATAQMAVIDNSNLAQTTLAASRALSELQQLTAQYNQLVATYQMLTNPVDVTSMVTGLNVGSLQNPLPNVASLSGLITGQTPTTGLGSTFYSQSHIFSPTDGSPSSSQLIANANSIANLQGVATTNLQAIQQRMALLPALEAALTGATSITEVGAINGRIALEANYVQGQQAQAQNLAILASQQEESRRQQDQEAHAQAASTLATQYQAGAGIQ
jgi:type IV secretion system protein VirB5